MAMIHQPLPLCLSETQQIPQQQRWVQSRPKVPGARCSGFNGHIGSRQLVDTRGYVRFHLFTSRSWLDIVEQRRLTDWSLLRCMFLCWQYSLVWPWEEFLAPLSQHPVVVSGTHPSTADELVWTVRIRYEVKISNGENNHLCSVSVCFFAK